MLGSNTNNVGESTYAPNKHLANRGKRASGRRPQLEHDREIQHDSRKATKLLLSIILATKRNAPSDVTR